MPATQVLDVTQSAARFALASDAGGIAKSSRCFFGYERVEVSGDPEPRFKHVSVCATLVHGHAPIAGSARANKRAIAGRRSVSPSFTNTSISSRFRIASGRTPCVTGPRSVFRALLYPALCALDRSVASPVTYFAPAGHESCSIGAGTE